jgi:hypothetical protein
MLTEAQYAKSLPAINPSLITPKGPLPDVQGGFEPDFSTIPVGGISLPEVIQHSLKLFS